MPVRGGEAQTLMAAKLNPRGAGFCEAVEELCDSAVSYLNGDLSAAGFTRVLKGQPFKLRDTELWRAAKEALKNGRHLGPCDNGGRDIACRIHLRTFESRRRRLINAIGQRVRLVEDGGGRAA